ncbi:MAG: hypothetical protein M3Z27_01315 [Actinomycetota bacterium]|nr:hypothetical protein [Actinomycetota bacterium]
MLETLHAGGAVFGQRVWGILGASGRGKSTTLARLDQRQVPVLADDALVLHGRTALAGPRVVYLRSDAPRGLGLAAGGPATAAAPRFGSSSQALRWRPRWAAG